MPAKKKATKKKAVAKKKEVKKVTLTKAKTKKASSVAKTDSKKAADIAQDKIVRAAKGGAVVVDVGSDPKEKGKESYSVVIRGGKAVKVLDSDNPELY